MGEIIKIDERPLKVWRQKVPKVPCLKTRGKSWKFFNGQLIQYGSRESLGELIGYKALWINKGKISLKLSRRMKLKDYYNSKIFRVEKHDVYWIFTGVGRQSWRQWSKDKDVSSGPRSSWSKRNAKKVPSMISSVVLTTKFIGIFFRFRS